MKKLILIVLSLILFSCNTATKKYLYYPSIKQGEIQTINGNSISFHTLGLRASDYGMYTDTAWAYNTEHLWLWTKKLLNPVEIAWVTQEQIRWGLPVHPFYYSTGGVESDSVFRPPFHIQVQCNYLYRSDVMEAVWLLNNSALYPTRELDLFESGSQNIIPEVWQRPRLWFADHYGDVAYVNRKASIVELYAPPKGVNQIDLFVFKNHALRYVNGKLVKETILDLDYEFKILITVIVNGVVAYPVEWHINKIVIEKLK